MYHMDTVILLPNGIIAYAKFVRNIKMIAIYLFALLQKIHHSSDSIFRHIPCG